MEICTFRSVVCAWWTFSDSFGLVAAMNFRAAYLCVLVVLLVWSAKSTRAQTERIQDLRADDIVFWIDAEDRSIYRGRPDESHYVRILSPRLPLATDVSGDFYWLDGSSGSLLRTARVTGATDTLLSGLQLDDWERTSLVAAPASGWIFWVGPEDDERTRNIIRASLDGGGPVTIIPNTQASSSVDLAVHSAAERIYWTIRDPESNTDEILSAAFDGTEVDTVFAPTAKINGIAIDPAGQAVYWSESGSIMRANEDGSDPVAVVSEINPTALAVDSDAGILYWHDRAMRSNHRVAIGGGLIEEMATDLPGDAEVRDLHVEDGRIVYLVRDWTGLSSIFAWEIEAHTQEELVAGFVAPAGLAVDADDERVYWTDRGGKILSADFDGDRVETVRWGRCGMGALTDVAIDARNRALFWGEVGDCGEGLHRMPLGEAGGEISSYEGPYGVEALALDPISGVIYFADSNPPSSIHRIDPSDGQTVEILRAAASGLAAHPLQNNLYGASCFEGRIFRSRLDGGNAEEVMTGLDCPLGLVLDADSDRIYWSERGHISRARTDGSDVEVVFSGLNDPAALAATFENRMSSLVEDTLDWRPYYPLAQGNVWEYVTENPFAQPFFLRMEIVGDTTIRNLDYDIQNEDHFGSDSVRTYSRRRFLRHDDAARTIVEFSASRESDVAFSLACDLGAPLFRDASYLYTCPQSEGATFVDQVYVTGEYSDAHLRVGRDSVAYAARKMFCWMGPCDEYLHGIGVPGWLEEGGLSQTTLVYLRLGDREFGSSITATSSERPASPPAKARLHVAPNPMQGDGVIVAEVPHSGTYELALYDATGRRLARLDLHLIPNYPQETRWSEFGRSLPAGVYFTRLSAKAEGAPTTVVSVVVVD